MGRYHPTVHNTPVACTNDRCSAKNAPESDSRTCWRCDAPLRRKPEIGEQLTVDIVDETSDGRAIGKTESGFVLFLDTAVTGLEATVEVTSITANSGEAIRIDSAVQE